MPDAAAAAPPPLVLGAGMFSRTRPRLGTAHGHRRSGSIGAVARSTVGFGRIVASPASARPRVTTDALTTTSLRPPMGPWTRWSIPEPEPEPAPSWTTRAARPVHRRDRQVTPAAAETPAPQPRPQTTKVDSLRRLLEQRGMIEPTADAPVERPAASGDESQADSTAIADRGATTAGPTTAPGELARRTRPQPTATPDRLSAVFPDTPPTQRSRRTAAPSSGADRFRDALATHGFIEPTPDRPGRARRSTRGGTAASTPTTDDGRARPGERGDDPGAGGDGRRAGRADPTRRRASDRDEPDAPPGPSARTSPPTSPTNAPSRREPPAGGAAERPGAPAGRRPTEALTSAVTTATRAAARSLPFSLLPEHPVALFRSSFARGDIRPGIHDRHGVTAGDDDAGGDALGSLRTLAPPTGPALVPDTAPVPVLEPARTNGGFVRRHPPDADDRAPSPRRAVRGPEARRRRHAIEEDGRDTSKPDATAPGTADRQATIDIAAPTTRVPDRVRDVAAQPTRQLLRRLGTRVGLPHSRSLEHPPTTELASLIARLAPAPTGSVAPANPSGEGAAQPAHVADMGSTPPRPARRSTPDRRGAAPPLLRRPGSVIADLARAPRPAAGDDGTPAVARVEHVGSSALRRALTTMRDSARSPGSPPAVAERDAPQYDPTDRPIRRNAGHARPDGGATPVADRAAATAWSSARDDVRPALRRRVVTPETAPVAPETATVAPVDPGSTPPEVDRLSTTPPQHALADRFLRELGREPSVSTRDLPQPFQPLASAIAGSASRVRISTDAASTRALTSVGKRAATVGEVIHLRRAPEVDGRAHEVIAHELTHVAHPSPVPRFFDDEQRGPEERMAEQVAAVIARSPVMPSAPAPSGAVGSSAPAGVVQRAPSRHAGPPRPGTVSASDLAASLSGAPRRGAATAGSGGVVRRATAGLDDPTFSTGQGAGTPVVRRLASDQMAAIDADFDEGGAGGASPFADERTEREWFERMIAQSIDHVVRRVEERVMIDLERRGGRNWRNL